MAVKQNGYKILKLLVQNRQISTFEEIFEIISRTRLARDAKIHYNRLGNKVRNPEKFTVKDIRTLAKLIDIDPLVLFSFIWPLAEKKSRKPSSH